MDLVSIMSRILDNSSGLVCVGKMLTMIDIYNYQVFHIPCIYFDFF